MSRKLEERVRQLERQLSQAMRDRDNTPQRLANPMAARTGRHLAFLLSSLSQGGTSTAEILAFSNGALIRTGIELQIQDMMLNVGKSIPADTKLWIVWDKTVWTWQSAYCEPSDTLPEEA